MTKIYIIEDEPIMADVIGLAAQTTQIPTLGGKTEQPVIEVFNDAVSAMNAVREELPDLILLDVLLSGPDGFTFLNEMISYTDTAKIPVILISTLDLSHRNLEHYGVRQTLDKATMTPEDINEAIIKSLTSSKTPATPPSNLAELNQYLESNAD